MLSRCLLPLLLDQPHSKRASDKVFFSASKTPTDNFHALRLWVNSKIGCCHQVPNQGFPS